jgi:hypothetical protein
MGGDDREGIVRALVWARDRGCAVLCATSDPGFVQMLVDAGGRRVHLEGGRIAGAPAIGLVPAPVDFSTENQRENADASQAIPLTVRRSSGEESS